MIRPVIVARLLPLLLLLALSGKSWAGWKAHRDLVVADQAPGRRPAIGDVRITYLGTNGYLFEARDASLIVDPYISRIGLWATARNAKVSPDAERLRQVRQRLPKRVNAVLVTHGHIDHLLDAGPLACATRAPLVASSSSVLLAQAAGATHCRSVKPGDLLRFGRCTVRVLPAAHDRLFGLIPFPGCRHLPCRPPARVADWVCGQPLAFLIEIGGQRIYLDSGGTRALLPPQEVAPVDLAILGVALPDSRRRFAEAVRRLRPRYVLPSHQDDFFRPLERGFGFGLLTNFPDVRRQHAVQRLPGRIILLDYFRPWTLH